MPPPMAAPVRLTTYWLVLTWRVPPLSVRVPITPLPLPASPRLSTSLSPPFTVTVASRLVMAPLVPGAAVPRFTVSLPALASPITLALDDCACSRKDEKSCVLSGWRTWPTDLPPLASTTAFTSRSSAWPKA